MFANQEKDITELPLKLQYSSIKDVSLEYAGYTNIEVPIRFSSICPPENGLLAAWGIGQWNFIGWGQVDQQKIRYSVNKNVLYMPTFYSNKTQTPVNYPFMLNEAGEIRFFEPDTNRYELICISGVLQFNPTWIYRMISGVFEGTNRRDFSDARVLHTIKDLPGNYFQSVKIKKHTKFRYVRYVSPKDKYAYCNVAEIRFYGSNGIELNGKPIGTPGVYFAHPEMTFDKAFDGNCLTFFCADNNDSWTGLDLGKPEQISEIHYLPRTEDGYGIYDRQVYELFFWNGQEWQSLGKQEASLYSLTYRVPANALFYMKNVTTGIGGDQVFVAQNGIQKWL
jgi:hypothetical protein